MSDEEPLQQAPGYAGVGARLRTAREAAGLSLADIAARTRIAERHLAEIEQGRFSALASRTYAVGFSRTYAKALGLDPAGIVADVGAELGLVNPSSDDRQIAVFEPGDPARGPSRGTAWLAALAAFVVVLAGFTIWRTYYVPSMALPPLVADDAPTGPEGGASPAPGPGAAPQGPVTLTATQPAVWIKVYDAAGVQLFQKELALGESYAVPGDANGPMLWTARPDALTVRIGDKDVPPLADRQVTIKDVPVSAGALLARAAAPAIPAAALSPAPPPGQVRSVPPMAAARREPQQRTARPAPAPSPSGTSTPAAAAPAVEAPAAPPAPSPTSTVSE